SWYLVLCTSSLQIQVASGCASSIWIWSEEVQSTKYHDLPLINSSASFFPQHEFQHFLRMLRHPYRREGLPVQRRRPKLAQAGNVLGTAVALVGGEIVGGKHRRPAAD